MKNRVWAFAIPAVILLAVFFSSIAFDKPE